jgi:hypothetical protein
LLRLETADVAIQTHDATTNFFGGAPRFFSLLLRRRRDTRTYL